MVWGVKAAPETARVVEACARAGLEPVTLDLERRGPDLEGKRLAATGPWLAMEEDVVGAWLRSGQDQVLRQVGGARIGLVKGREGRDLERAD